MPVISRTNLPNAGGPRILLLSPRRSTGIAPASGKITSLRATDPDDVSRARPL